MKSSQLEICWSPTRRRKARIGGLRAETHITERDACDFNRAQEAVWRLLQDGQWHTRDEFCAVTGQVEALRRVREVDALIKPLGLGEIESRRQGMTRVFEYRLKFNSLQSDTVCSGNTHEGLPGRDSLDMGTEAA